MGDPVLYTVVGLRHWLLAFCSCKDGNGESVLAKDSVGHLVES